MNTTFRTSDISRLFRASAVVISTLLLNGIGSVAYAQSFSSGPDQLVNRLCTNQCAQQNETMAVDGSGNSIAIWSEPYGDTNAIVTARFDAATGRWGGSRLLAAENGAIPQVGFDGSGNALAVWNTYREGYYILRYSRFVASQGSWTRPADGVTLPVYGFGERLVVAKNGDAFVLNGGRNGDGSVARFDAATGAWAFFDAVQGDRLAADGAGNAVLLSIRQPAYGSGPVSIYAQRYNAASKQWSGTTLLDRHEQVFDTMGNSNGEGTIAAPGLSMDQYGNVTSMWTKSITADSGAITRTIKSARYVQSRSVWVGKAVPKISNGPTNGTVMAVDRGANVTAVWNQYVGLYAKTVASRYSSTTGTWSTPKVIQSGNFHTREANVGADSQGNVTVSWSQRGDTGTQPSLSAIFRTTAAQFSPATATWGIARTIQDANRAGYRSYMGVDAQGRALVMWTQQSGRYANGTEIKEIRSDRLLP